MVLQPYITDLHNLGVHIITAQEFTLVEHFLCTTGLLYYSPVTRKLQNSMCWHELEMSINLSANEKGEGFSSLQMNWNRCSVSLRSLIKTTQDLYLFYMKRSFYTCLKTVWKYSFFKNGTIESSFMSALYHFMN